MADSSSSAPGDCAVQRVSLETALFDQALTNYIDYSKPDPLSRKQLEAWKLTWEERESESKKESDDKLSSTSGTTYAIHGDLSVQGEYMIVKLNAQTTWTPTAPKQGRLVMSCKASASFVESDADAATIKMRKKIKDRFQKDAYIVKLLGKDPVTVLQANILFTDADLEERVFGSEDVCQGIQRAVWSSAESPLDVMELLVQFPWLPTPVFETSLAAVTTLANRAKLRLLEDAMCDACEKEGEDEMVQDLQISDKPSAASTAKSNSSANQPRKKQKGSR